MAFMSSTGAHDRGNGRENEAKTSPVSAMAKGEDFVQRVRIGQNQLIRNRFSGARAPARLPVRVRTQTG
jgi:hypothetical protein